jgi:hypothetical protein
VNVKNDDEKIRTHIKKVRLIQERPNSIFGELPAFQNQLLGRPLTQRQLRKLLKRGHLHPDFDPDEKSNILQEGSQSSGQSSLTYTEQIPATKQNPQPAEATVRIPTKLDQEPNTDRLTDWVTEQNPSQVRTNQNEPESTNQPQEQVELEPEVTSQSVLDDLPKSVRNDFRTMSTKLSRRIKQFQHSAQHKIEKLFSPIRTESHSAKEKDMGTETLIADNNTVTDAEERNPKTNSIASTPTGEPDIHSTQTSVQAPQPPRSETSVTSTTTHAVSPAMTRRGLRNRPRVDYKLLHTTGRKTFK